MKPDQNHAQSGGPISVNLPGKDLATNAQVQTLLSIVGMSMSALGHFLQFPEEEPSKENRLSGETRIAAETTFINACHTLDEIMADKNRWSNEFQMQLERDYADLHRRQLKFVETQQAAADEINTPHFRYKPVLGKTNLGMYVAFLGDAAQWESAIIGFGPSPQEAIEAFDAVFEGREFRPALKAWLEKRAQDLENGNTLEPYPIDETQVDRDRDGHASPDAEAGGQQPNDSGLPPAAV